MGVDGGQRGVGIGIVDIGDGGRVFGIGLDAVILVFVVVIELHLGDLGDVGLGEVVIVLDVVLCSGRFGLGCDVVFHFGHGFFDDVLVCVGLVGDIREGGVGQVLGRGRLVLEIILEEGIGFLEIRLFRMLVFAEIGHRRDAVLGHDFADALQLGGDGIGVGMHGRGRARLAQAGRTGRAGHLHAGTRRSDRGRAGRHRDTGLHAGLRLRGGVLGDGFVLGGRLDLVLGDGVCQVVCFDVGCSFIFGFSGDLGVFVSLGDLFRGHFGLGFGRVDICGGVFCFGFGDHIGEGGFERLVIFGVILSLGVVLGHDLFFDVVLGDVGGDVVFALVLGIVCDVLGRRFRLCDRCLGNRGLCLRCLGFLLGGGVIALAQDDSVLAVAGLDPASGRAAGQLCQQVGIRGRRFRPEKAIIRGQVTEVFRNGFHRREGVVETLKRAGERAIRHGQDFV